MLFNSLQFLVFFPVVTLMYFLLPHRFRWMHLLAASCLFYMAFIPVYLLILLFTILVDYVAGILIEGATGRRRKWFLGLSIVANVGVLAVFKYFNFFLNNYNWALHGLHATASVPLLNIILPIGLSFHTFQAMSYTIEVYRGRWPAERHLGRYALYVMFYPQLVAGPIERPQNLLPQFYEQKRLLPDNVVRGVTWMLWGFFLKLVIADRISPYVNAIYSDPSRWTGGHFVLATLLFSFQIFADFAGYSTIAIGAARVMGFTLMKNFDRPYYARSISEFWKRWHISLSTWFRDYLYISLGGNRVSQSRWLLNLMIVFLVSGFWHGADWTFVVWGALHGSYLIAGILTQPWRARLAALTRLDRLPVMRSIFQALVTFALVTFAWIFFRARTFDDAWYIITHLGSGWQFSLNYVGLLMLPLTHGNDCLAEFLIAFSAIGLVGTIHLVQERQRSWCYQLWERAAWLRFTTLLGLLMSILFLGVFKSQSFIYFEF